MLTNFKFCEGQQLVIKIRIGTSKNANTIFAAAPISVIRSKLSGCVRCVILLSLNIILFLHLALHLSFAIIHVYQGTVRSKKKFFAPKKPTHLVLSDPLHTLHVMLLQAHQIGF